MKLLMIILAFLLCVDGSPIVLNKNRTSTTTPRSTTSDMPYYQSNTLPTVTSLPVTGNQDDEIEKIILSAIQQSTNNKALNNRFMTSEFQNTANGENLEIVVIQDPQGNTHYGDGFNYYNEDQSLNSNVRPEIQVVTGNFENIPDIKTLFNNNKQQQTSFNFDPSVSSYNYPVNSNNQYYNNYYPQSNTQIKKTNQNFPTSVIDLIGKFIHEH